MKTKTLKSRKNNVITIYNDDIGKTQKYRYREIPVKGTNYNKLVNENKLIN